jgi:Ca2+-binding EF-hand superfamily protein
VCYSELGVAFSTFDKDGDGQITADEVEMTINAMGLDLTREQVQMMVDIVDTDGTLVWSLCTVCSVHVMFA